MKWLLAFTLISFGSTAQIPDQVLRHWEVLTANGGTWIADNSAYINDTEKADAYGITWTYGLGKTSVTGRLFGIKDGKEFGTFWEFRVFYHPEQKKLMYHQYGWGAGLGIAEMKLIDDTRSEDVVALMYPDGTSSKVKHENDTRSDIQYAQSYEWKDGEWKKQRYYEWKKKVE